MQCMVFFPGVPVSPTIPDALNSLSPRKTDDVDDSDDDGKTNKRMNENRYIDKLCDTGIMCTCIYCATTHIQQQQNHIRKTKRTADVKNAENVNSYIVKSLFLQGQKMIVVVLYNGCFFYYVF